MTESSNEMGALRASTNDTRSRWKRRLLIVMLALVLLGFAYYGAALAWQHWLAPRVDPTLNRLSNIGYGEVPIAESLPGLLANLSQEAIDAAEYPLDPVLELADAAQAYIKENIRDYTSIMVNQVRVGSRPLREEQYMFCKIRHRQESPDGGAPFSIYTRFLAPQSVLGQEAIWIEGRNEGKLVGHPAGLLNVARFWLEPDGPIAMDGNLHPMYEMGFARFLDILLERGARERTVPGCRVSLTHDVAIDDRPCLMLEVKHPQKQDGLDFHIARIYIDIGHQIPVGYEGYLWPEKPGDPPLLIEKYLYTQLKLNVGLTDADFDPDNPEYNFPGGKSR